MELIVISGRSGSGKSTALHQLEDLGYYCVDNLPAALLPTLTEQLERDQYAAFKGVAVCIDARNSAEDLATTNEVLQYLPSTIDCKVIFLDAHDPTLTKRFSETRRRHPLSGADRSLTEAIQLEGRLLSSLAARADLVIDTSELNLYDLRGLIDNQLGGDAQQSMTVLVESFGFKRGVPLDADLLFDARLLPNPHWVTELRAKTGQDPEVAAFLESHSESGEFVNDIVNFLQRWLPDYSKSQRSYMTVAIGCTGGQHRSVYIAERVHGALQTTLGRVQIRHRDLMEGSAQ